MSTEYERSLQQCKEACYPGEKPASGGHYRGLRMPEGVVERQPDRAAVWTFQEAEEVGGGEVVCQAVKHIHVLLPHTSDCTFVMRK